MQIIIDIPDSAYKVCHDLRNVGDTNCLADILVNAVGIGTPISNNATNGDVMKIIFPKIGVYDEWYDEPYQKENKNE